MNKKNAIKLGAALLIVIILFIAFSGNDKTDNQLVVSAEKGDLVVSITATGELMAAQSEKVYAPGQGMRSVNIWQVNITDLVDEGTKVDSGSYIGTLDRGEIGAKLKENEIEILKSQSVYTQTQLDTTLNMREARNELSNLKFAMEEAQITLDQSKFEPPATIRQNKISLEKAELKYAQTVKNYQVKKLQFEAKMEEARATLNQAQKKQEKIEGVIDKFIIKAPKPGILIYAKNWNGAKRVVGSRVSAWDPTVALLPNLAKMVSITYINEVDIGKIQKGQKVAIELDGAPDKKLTGSIEYVASVGEQLPNSEAKVYEVKVTINETDSTLLPGMSTSNKIIVERFDNILKLPIESVFSNDSASFVYLKSGFGIELQEVETGSSNVNYVIIKRGLEEDQSVLFTEPEDASSFKLKPLE